MFEILKPKTQHLIPNFMFSSFHYPHYFTKKIREEIGEIYAHSAIANLALSMMALFEPIFLYSVLGFTINQVLVFTVIVYGVYILCIPFGGKMASMYGYKHSIALSIPFHIVYWLILISAQQSSNLAFVGAVAYGLSKSFYWPGYHSLIARYSDEGQVGREFGVVYSLISLTLVAGPLIAGAISQHVGFTAMFTVTALIYCFSLFPLFRHKEIFTPKVYEYKQTIELYKQYPKKALGYFGFGEEMFALNIWPIYIFIVVKNYETAGLLATVSSLVAAGLALIVGRITDQYSKRVLIKIGAFFTGLVWLGRFVANAFWSTFFMDSLARTSKEISIIPISTVTYIRAEATHVVPYIVFFEQSLAIGKLTACFVGIILFTLTGSFVVLFIAAALYSLLYMLV